MKRFLFCLLALFASSVFLNAIGSVQNDYMMGRDAFYKHEYQTAIRYYNNAIEKDPNYTDAYCGKGEAEIELKKFDDAIESYTRAIELDGSKVDALMGRAAAYGLKPKPNLKLARLDLDKVIEIDSNNTEAYVSRSVVNYGLKDKKSAYKDINYVLEIEPDNPQAHAVKAMIEFSDFKFGDAMKHFGKYNELSKEKEEVKKPVVPKFEQGYGTEL